ncbi:MAG TPA: IclR family transcriptional regulator [Syntrophorhabdaceae bacterium]|nr:IclR family transcriptional regulator [Syntrophorhabdaceae bacterium]
MEEKKLGKGSSASPAVEQAARVLICLGKNPSFKMKLTEICNAVGIHKSKGHSILSALVKHGLVQKDPDDKTYSLGPGIISLSRKVLDNLNYGELVGPSLEVLANATKSTALFGVISEESLIVVAKREVDTGIGITMGIGHRLPVTWGAHGKAVFSFMDDEQKKKVLSRKKLYFNNEQGKFDIERLNAETDACKKNGYSFDIGQMSKGINAIASPVFGAGRNPIGAVFVLGTFPEALVPTCGPMVAEKAVEVSRLFGAETESVFGIIGIKGVRHV